MPVHHPSDRVSRIPAMCLSQQIELPRDLIVWLSKNVHRGAALLDVATARDAVCWWHHICLQDLDASHPDGSVLHVLFSDHEVGLRMLGIGTREAEIRHGFLLPTLSRRPSIRPVPVLWCWEDAEDGLTWLWRQQILHRRTHAPRSHRSPRTPSPPPIQRSLRGPEPGTARHRQNPPPGWSRAGVIPHRLHEREPDRSAVLP
ncbi:hypothetical protein GCM10010156_73080 [Planobispora rosea]|uniref:Uncharacterized protein n=1 Tax=Planobispora rosea TaxID=35762 RepID=A0A8J3WGU2_PLARO|nr:hypothetical protein [Planobispora rosea]GGT04647.1 hypothetical protein GCM10010156_73080 [Planobispora rosea]GIH88880.1 hypothetical protein Pro02_72880 [Planobispora rosea]